jgi:Ca-activated chloride channel homolog
MSRAAWIALAGLCAAWLALAPPAARADSPRQALESATRLYERGQFEEALAEYREGLLKFPWVPELHQGAGNALYRLKRYPEAVKEFQEAARASDPRLRAAGRYNQGDAEVRSNQLPQSLENFKEALRQHPEDPDAKFNYELIRARLEDSKQSKQQQQKGGGSPEKKQPDKGGDRPKPQEGGAKGPKPGRDPQQLSKEQAEQLLKALASDEQKLQGERLKSRVSEHRLEKDW